jgi:hypothetical protein
MPQEICFRYYSENVVHMNQMFRLVNNGQLIISLEYAIKFQLGPGEYFKSTCRLFGVGNTRICYDGN